MDIVSIMTDMAAVGGADVVAPAPILGSDALPAFADLLSQPDPDGVSDAPLTAAFAAILPANGNVLPLNRQIVAAGKDDADGEEMHGLPSATQAAEDDRDAANGAPMWLPLSLDLPTVVSRSLTPMVAPSADRSTTPAMVASPAIDRQDIVSETSYQAAAAVGPSVPGGTAPALAKPPVNHAGAEPASSASVGNSNANGSISAAGVAPPSAPLPFPAAGAISSVPAAPILATNVIPGVLEPVAAPVGSAAPAVAPVVETIAATATAPILPAGPVVAVPAPSPVLTPNVVNRMVPEPAPSSSATAANSVPVSPVELDRPGVRASATALSMTSATGDNSGPARAASAVTTEGPVMRHGGMPARSEAPVAPVVIEVQRGDAPSVRSVAAISVPAETTTAQPAVTDGLQASPPAVVAAPVGVAAPATIETARAPAPQGPVLDTSRADWLDTLVDRVEEARATGPVRVTHMKLLPDALGALDVRIRVEGERVHVTFTTDSPEARAIIADAAPKLAEMAEARGLRLGQAQVDLGAGTGGGQQRAASGRDADLPAAPSSARRDQPEDQPETAADRPRVTRDRLA